MEQTQGGFPQAAFTPMDPNTNFELAKLDLAE